MRFYKDTEQISELIDLPPFELPHYGPSTTDPSYYEPQATRIANMRKSASNSVAMYDFEGDNIKLAENINDVHVMVGRKPGITQEEISQLASENVSEIKRQSKVAENEAKEKETAKTERIQEAVEAVKASQSDNA